MNPGPSLVNSMRRSICSALIIWIIVFCSTAKLPAHPFKAGIFEIKQNSVTGRIEVTVRLFTDDLEECVREKTGRPLNLDTGKEYPSADVLINEYIQGGFRIEVNGEPVSLEYLGREHEPGVTWCYLESRVLEPVSEISVVNSIMTELYSTQSNIVHIQVGKEKKSLLLGPEKLFGKAAFRN